MHSLQGGTEGGQSFTFARGLFNPTNKTINRLCLCFLGFVPPYTIASFTEDAAEVAELDFSN
jgi:hypothetical protein